MGGAIYNANYGMGEPMYCRFRFVSNSRASVPVIRDSIRKLCNMHVLCLSRLCPANEGIRVLVCHGGNMDCWRTQYTSKCGSKASASRVFINSQERACTSGRVESTAESASFYCGQTHIVDAGDLDCQMMVSHPYPCFSRPPPPFSTSTSLTQTHSLSLPLHFLSHLTSSLFSPPPTPCFPYFYMSLHEQVQLSMKLTGSEPNHFSLIRLIYDESH